MEQQRETSWLFTDERYHYIRNLALTDKIAVITQSICAYESFLRIRSVLTENAIQIDTIYVSNIGEWIFGEQQTSFIETITALLTENETILIDAQVKNPQNNEPPSQRCILKKDITPQRLRDWFFPGKKQESIEELNTIFTP